MNEDYVEAELAEDVEPSQAEARLAELRIRLDRSLPYRIDTMFPRIQGLGAKGELKKKAKVIAAVEPALHKALREGEEVLYIAKGVQQSVFETMFLGAIGAALLNQTVFVLTNARILMFRTDSSDKPRPTCWMLYYSEINKFKRSWLGSLALTLKDGRKMTFGGFTKTDGKAMPGIFEEALETYRQRGFQPNASQSQENLCSHCYECVPKGEYQCPECAQEFWTPGEVAKRSLIFPSWGDFTMGHTGLACFEVIGYSFALCATIIVAVEAIRRGRPVDTIYLAVIPILCMHAFDAFITYFVARKGLHPKGRQ